MDPLVDVLARLEVRGRVSSTLVVHGTRWRLGFEAPDGWKFNAVREGSCTVSVEGSEPVVLRAGDCFLLTQSRPFELAGDLGVPLRPARPVFEQAHGGTARVEAGGGDVVTRAVGGSFAFAGRASLLSDALPPLLVVPAGSGAASPVERTLVSIDDELTSARPGAAVVADHLGVVMLVHVLRWYMQAEDARSGGWLAALTDPVVAPALSAMHRAPQEAWTVAALAREALVSRSTMAQRFRVAVGVAPLDYLTTWRMELAAQRLRRDEASVASVARSVGYRSEAAFSTAFKRVRGVTPRQEALATRGGRSVTDRSTTDRPSPAPATG